MNFKNYQWLFLSWFLGASSGLWAQNFLNGDFATPLGGMNNCDAGANWTTSSGALAPQYTDCCNTPNIGFWVDLTPCGGFGNGSFVEQTVTGLTIGQQYNVSFRLGTLCGWDVSDAGAYVSVNGTQIGGRLFNNNFSCVANTMNWLTVTSNNFTATATSATIRITGEGRCSANSPTSGGFACTPVGSLGNPGVMGLDDVVLNRVTAACTIGNTATFTNPSCLNNDGTAAVTATNAQGSVSYLWSNGRTTSSVTGLAAGTYTVTITDSVSTSGSTVTVFSDAINAGSAWTLNVPTGANGADNNFWVINDNEGGVVVNNCGVAGGGDATLHITSVFNPSGGAAYNAGLGLGICGAPLFLCSETNMRAESATFSTVGRSNLTLDFDYIANGDALLDNASVFYNAGAGWQLLDNSFKSTTCPSGQGLWTRATYTLPAAAENQPVVQIAFNWTNNDDGAGTDPSVAINNVLVTASSTGAALVCTVVDTFVLTAPAGFTVAASNTNIGCVNTTGTATVTTNQGAAPFTFQWSNNRTTQTITGLAVGSYAVTVTDANNCQQTASVSVVNASTSVSVTIVSTNNVSCFGANDGGINITPVGGTAPYTFGWSNGTTTEDLTNVDGGFYAVNVFDANGCFTNTNPIFISSPDSFTLRVDTNSLLLCNNLNAGNLTAVAAGGSQPLSYNWSNGATTANIANLSQGSYIITVSQGNGCTATLSQTIALNAPIIPNLAAFVSVNGTTSVTTTIGSTVDISVGNDQTAQGVTYQWTANPTVTIPNATNAVTTISPLTTTTVTVAALSPNNCSATADLVINITASLNLPSAFTPNGDNNNERFRPLNFPVSNIRKFTIFNRWGQVVYDDNTLTNGGWDGKLNGVEQPRDAYVYLLEVQEPQKTTTTTLRGEFTLIR